jgi:hypothetical protein
MTNLDLQQVIIYRNERLKLAHIAVNNMFTNKGQRNYSATLNGAYNSAKYAVRGAANNPSTEYQFGSAFVTRLMNTGISEWSETDRVENLNINPALRLARELRETLESEGYDVTGCFRGKSIRNTGIKGITNFVIKNATQSRIFDIVTKLTVGIEDLNITKTRRVVYMQYIKDQLQTRRQIWYFIQENLDTLTQ